MNSKQPIRDQRIFIEAVVWTMARIAQELISSFWFLPASRDKNFADKVTQEYRLRLRDEWDIEEEWFE